MVPKTRQIRRPSASTGMPTMMTAKPPPGASTVVT
jgi:hypothetical protein